MQELHGVVFSAENERYDRFLSKQISINYCSSGLI